MITVQGRKLIIPKEERNIGTIADNHTTTRIFKLNRFSDGVDISTLNFKLNIEYTAEDGSKIKNTAELDKRVSDHNIYLEWVISKADLPGVGVIYIQIRACDLGFLRFNTASASMFVDGIIGDYDSYKGDLSELRFLEAKIGNLYDRFIQTARDVPIALQAFSGNEKAAVSDMITLDKELSRIELVANTDFRYPLTFWYTFYNLGYKNGVETGYAEDTTTFYEIGHFDSCAKGTVISADIKVKKYTKDEIESNEMLAEKGGIKIYVSPGYVSNGIVVDVGGVITGGIASADFTATMYDLSTLGVPINDLLKSFSSSYSSEKIEEITASLYEKIKTETDRIDGEVSRIDNNLNSSVEEIYATIFNGYYDKQTVESLIGTAKNEAIGEAQNLDNVMSENIYANISDVQSNLNSAENRLATQIQTESESLQAQINSANDDIGNLSTNVLNIQSEIGTMSNNIDKIKVENEKTNQSIADLNDKKITKFYANNLGETTLSDSDNGKIVDVMIYGKSAQDGTPTPENPVEIQSVVNPVVKVYGKNLIKTTLQTKTVNGITCTNNGDGTYTLNGTATNNTDFTIFNETVNFKNVKLLGCPKGGSKTTYRLFMFWDNILGNNVIDYGDGSNTISIDNVNLKVNISTFNGVTYNNVVFKPMITTNLNATYNDFESYKEQTVTLPHTLNAIPVSSGGNVTIDGQEYIADYVDIEHNKIYRLVNPSKLEPTVSILDNTDLLLLEEEVTDLTAEEVQAFKDLATYYPTTNVFVTSEQLNGYTTFNYPISLANGWNYVKKQLGDTREYIYDMDLQSAEAYINSEYAVALSELGV